MDGLVALAGKTIAQYVRTGTFPDPPDPLPAEMNARAGVFVSLKTLSGDLRGCMGTAVPHEENVAREIIQNAVSAATRDPRFPPVAPAELDNLRVSVDVLTAPEPVAGLEALDPRRYGVVVRAGTRTGLLLPDLPGIDTVEMQIAIARRKAGIAPGEPAEILRFEVERHT